MSPIELKRTFQIINEPQDEEDGAYAFGADYLGDDYGRLTWPDLHRRHVAVVLGEAGIGKTFEFRLEAQRLAADGQAAFFVALNKLGFDADWDDALGNAMPRFERWKAGTELGHFHLDSVDEARLTKHADLDRALGVVARMLRPHMDRARIIISSRVSDWTVDEVRNAVEVRLLGPINEAVAAAAADGKTAIGIPEADASGAVAPKKGYQIWPVTPRAADEDAPEDLLVSALDPLSEVEAKRCARHFKVEDEHGFWLAVADGGYEFMATRPLDLEWMVRRWNRGAVPRTLGSYAELCEANVTERLAEFNHNYTQAGKALSSERLRAGAEDVAAATTFGGHGFVGLTRSATVDSRVLDPYDVLLGWQPDEVQQLLNTAVFDEASFNQVKFHHRSIREYLAACWMNRLLGQAVPLHRLRPLVAVPLAGKFALIPARKPSLSWLAAISATAREWVVRHTPELLLHEGDPHAWGPSAELAFRAVIANAATTPETAEPRPGSVDMRIAQAIGPGPINSALGNAKAPWQAFSVAIRLASNGRVTDCADAVFAIYCDCQRPEHDRAAAISVLDDIAGPEHRKQLLADMVSGAMTGNALLSAALPATQWFTLTVEQLAGILQATTAESARGAGSMGSAVERRMLRAADLAGASTLLGAVLQALPRQEDGSLVRREYFDDEHPRGWLAGVFPACLLRVLELAVVGQNPPIDLCVRSAIVLEELLRAGYAEPHDINDARAAIHELPALRWEVALRLALADPAKQGPGWLGWDLDAPVSFSADDLPELTRRANDVDLAPEAREAWFSIAVEIAGRQEGGRMRAGSLRALCRGNPERATVARTRLKKLLGGNRWRTNWKRDDEERQAVQQAKLAAYIDKLLPRLPGFADGSDTVGLSDLLLLLMGASGWRDQDGIDFQYVASVYGPVVATAFKEGLLKVWTRHSPGDPTESLNGSTPKETLLALAGLNAFVLTGELFSDLSEEQVGLAARIAVWAPSVPLWFPSLWATRPQVVKSVLEPRILREACAGISGNGARGALKLAMDLPPPVGTDLLANVVDLVRQDRIPNELLVQRLVPTLRAHGLMPGDDVDTVCRRALDRTDGVVADANLVWLRQWVETRPLQTWEWLKGRLATLPPEGRLQQMAEFASAVSDFDWGEQPWPAATVDLLLDISITVREYSSGIVPLSDILAHFDEAPTRRLIRRLMVGFVEVRGPLGRNALGRLLAAETDDDMVWQLHRAIEEHDGRDAAEASFWTPGDLRGLHEAFDGKPTTEAKLFQQALARLEEIKATVEDGPASERVLFSAGMPEEHLQLWLAAKLRDTQGRRFTVHREEELDRHDMPDIQLACAPAVVCLEIKPLDVSRYSPWSLVEDTLKRQMVGQYLKATNSSSGLLVLFQLDFKAWDLPGAPGSTFQDLVGYLQREADRIRADSPTVQPLVVVGISGVAGEKPKKARKNVTLAPSTGAGKPAPAKALVSKAEEPIPKSTPPAAKKSRKKT